MSKLYTEEQLRKAIDLSYSYGLAKPNSGRLSDIPNVQNKIIETLTPIQLPTADEILYESQGVFVNRIDMYEEGFIDGAEWVVNKIKGGQGE